MTTSPMTTPTTTPTTTLTDYDRYRTGQLLFEQRRFDEAARELELLLGGNAPAYGLGEAPLLLARAYYHSAQLGRAETAARGLLARDDTDGYAALLLGRTVQRRGRAAEAQTWLRRAAALGVDGSGS